MQAEVEIEGGGWIVSEQDHRGQVFYVGRDGYWSRVRQAVSPFRSRDVAQAMAADLNKQPRMNWR